MQVVLPLAQIIGAEGSLTYYFVGTNNLGAMHATRSFASAHAAQAGYGMVAFLDRASGGAAYIARMAVYPTLVAGAAAFLNLVEAMTDPTDFTGPQPYATALYAHGYFEGVNAPATPISQRMAAAQAASWTDADLANISAYASIISKTLPFAGHAYDNLPNYTGDPSSFTSGPPFAPLAYRLTPSPSLAPHTIEHARAILANPAPGGVSLDDALAAPGGDGVWMFGAGGAPEVAGGPSSEAWTVALSTLAAAGAVATYAFRLMPDWPLRVWHKVTEAI